VTTASSPRARRARGSSGARPSASTAGENDVATLGGDGFRLGRRVRPVVGNQHLVGKSSERSQRLRDEIRT
jgi:hypothetical protein